MFYVENLFLVASIKDIRIPTSLTGTYRKGVKMCI